MNSIKLSVVVLAAATLGSSAFAQSAVGSWKGHLQIAMPPMPANTPPAQRQMVEKMMSSFKKMVILMNLKSNKTYTTSTQGAPGGANKTESGTWSQAGRTITLNSPKKNTMGQPNSMNGTLGADNKSFTIVLPSRGGGGGKIVFVKA